VLPRDLAALFDTVPCAGDIVALSAFRRNAPPPSLGGERITTVSHVAVHNSPAVSKSVIRSNSKLDPEKPLCLMVEVIDPIKFVGKEVDL
jgi:hypothetical protein